MGRRVVARIWLVLPLWVVAAPGAQGAPPPKPLRFSCAEALADGTLVDPGQEFVASRHGSVWRGVAPLAITTEDGPNSVFFVRRRGGETAIRVEWRSAATDSGCAIRRYEVFTLRAGTLRRVESGDDSLTCVPCGCK